MAQLPLLGAVVGPFLGALMVFTDTYRRKKVMNKCKNMEPEQQLVLAMVGGVGFSVTMFWFTWTAPYP
jgi:Na+/H+ antiporter NhaA